MPDAPRPLPPKKDVALALLEREPSVFIHLDPRRPGVSVPRWFTGQPQLVLQVGMNMPIPIPDLKVDDEGISCTLSFSRTPFWCRIPWHAIWALVGEDQRGLVWPEDVPPELAAQRQQQKGPGLAVAPSPQKVPDKGAKRPRPRLAAVEAPSADSKSGAEGEAPSVGSKDAGDEDARERPRTRPVPVPDEPAGEPATPAPPARPRAVPQPAPAVARAPASASEDEGGEGEGAPRPAGGKPKRELPPYLRVIK
ncbi:MAG: hypothetical protein IT372_13185 [Polyangiaceae bacterium]|nr:hypothetical protein [Polyangiaceae bacterium]